MEKNEVLHTMTVLTACLVTAASLLSPLVRAADAHENNSKSQSSKKNSRAACRAEEIELCATRFVATGLYDTAVWIKSHTGQPEADQFKRMFDETRVGETKEGRANIVKYESERFIDDVANFGSHCAGLLKEFDPALAQKAAIISRCVVYDGGAITWKYADYARYRQQMPKELVPSLKEATLNLRAAPNFAMLISSLSNIKAAAEIGAGDAQKIEDRLTQYLFHQWGPLAKVIHRRPEGVRMASIIVKGRPGFVADVLRRRGFKDADTITVGAYLDRMRKAYGAEVAQIQATLEKKRKGPTAQHTGPKRPTIKKSTVFSRALAAALHDEARAKKKAHAAQIAPANDLVLR